MLCYGADFSLNWILSIINSLYQHHQVHKSSSHCFNRWFAHYPTSSKHRRKERITWDEQLGVPLPPPPEPLSGFRLSPRLTSALLTHANWAKLHRRNKDKNNERVLKGRCQNSVHKSSQDNCNTKLNLMIKRRRSGKVHGSIEATVNHLKPW